MDLLKVVFNFVQNSKYTGQEALTFESKHEMNQEKLEHQS